MNVVPEMFSMAQPKNSRGTTPTDVLDGFVGFLKNPRKNAVLMAQARTDCCSHARALTPARERHSVVPYYLKVIREHFKVFSFTLGMGCLKTRARN